MPNKSMSPFSPLVWIMDFRAIIFSVIGFFICVYFFGLFTVVVLSALALQVAAGVFSFGASMDSNSLIAMIATAIVLIFSFIVMIASAGYSEYQEFWEVFAFSMVLYGVICLYCKINPLAALGQAIRRKDCEAREKK